jgi:hypothetical protein
MSIRGDPRDELYPPAFNRAFNEVWKKHELSKMQKVIDNGRAFCQRIDREIKTSARRKKRRK